MLALLVGEAQDACAGGGEDLGASEFAGFVGEVGIVPALGAQAAAMFQAALAAGLGAQDDARLLGLVEAAFAVPAVPAVPTLPATAPRPLG